MTFGEYVKLKRQKAGITLRAFAEKLNIAPSYASDIEKGKRNAPSQEILNSISAVLNLDEEERNILFDLAAGSKNEIAQDLSSYVGEFKNIRVALRKAKEMNLGDEEWLRIIDEMLNLK